MTLQPTLAAAPAPAQEAAASAAAPGAGAGKTMGKAEFDALAGMAAHHGHAHKVRTPLPRRLSRTLAQLQQPVEHDDAETPLRTAAAQLIERLSDAGDDAHPWRRGPHDPLQQHTLLEQARQLLEQQPDDGGGQRARLGARLDAMEADLHGRHGAAIDEGTHQALAFEAALSTLDDGADGPGTLSDLRRRLGAPADGRRDAPLAPQALLDILLKNAGQAGAAAALGRPPARTREELRRRGRSGPRLWLSLQDASCFQLVNTSYALAGELRRELSERVQTTPLIGQGALARQLLRLGEPEGGQAGPLLRQMVDMQHLSPSQRAAACRSLRGVIARCPDGMWEGEALPRRNRLLEQLRQMTVDHHAALPEQSTTPEDALQSRLRLDHQRARSTGWNN
ncbi:hypothetical protein CSQ96_14805 [Janthinobacterium sp. BJB412]|nr:hypothetical protein CSQ96_14805 [Janthinobacterium sp. BJB412]